MEDRMQEVRLADARRTMDEERIRARLLDQRPRRRHGGAVGAGAEEAVERVLRARGTDGDRERRGRRRERDLDRANAARGLGERVLDRGEKVALDALAARGVGRPKRE